MAWGKVDDRLHSSPKWRAATKGARALWATALSWSMDQLTDGHVPRHMLTALDGTRAEAASLVACGLWHVTDDGWVFHDWSDYQPSREQVLAEREAAKERQRRARERAREAREARESRDRHAVTHEDVTPHVTVPPTRPDPTPTPSPDGEGTSAAEPADTARPDVEALCTLLANCIESNGARRPTVTKRWRDAARLLLDKDGYTVEQVEWMIRWATGHEFWRANVLSMPTLREKFDQLKLQATAGRARRPAPMDRVAEITALGAEMQADLEQRGA